MPNPLNPQRLLNKYNLAIVFSAFMAIVLLIFVFHSFFALPLDPQSKYSFLRGWFLPLMALISLYLIFLPITLKIQRDQKELEKSESDAKTLSIKLNKLYGELSKSYQDLESLKQTPPEIKTLGYMNLQGEFLREESKAPSVITEYDNFKSLLSLNDYSDDFIAGLFQLLDERKNWLGEIQIEDAEGDLLWFNLQLVPIYKGVRIKILGQDVTDIKEARQVASEINKERIDKIVEEQRYRSVLILEGQEEERKRLSKELHDSIGQMLTALKLNVESISPTDTLITKKRLEDTKFLLRRVIQETRRVSFNLAPPSLTEFGLVAALKKLTSEMARMTEINIRFENRTRFINRLGNNIETNIYRIIQESLNNACKYAEASEIVVSLAHNVNQLEIIIEDDGKGFDFSKLDSEGRLSKSGHGIFNIKERAAFINAEIDIDSRLSKGTKISLILRLDQMKYD